MTPPATPVRVLDAPPAPRSTESGVQRVREGLEEAAERLRGLGVAVPPVEGKLLRPLVAYALVPPERRGALDARFWCGALAVQMVHEASLLHDDILDEAGERRGEETLVARAGVGPALVLGDHYLTGAYRAAAETEAPGFLACFIRAVERTVAGEIAQERNAGQRLDMGAYLDVVRGKSGELFGAAACLGGAVIGSDDLVERVELGRELG
ncbi:MAG: polyprenyl synthetase family protein, partial [Gemmatimonadota bacterium]